MSDLRAILRSLTYFQGISPETLERVATSTLLKRVESGAMIFIEGEPSAGLWIVRSGHVKIYKLNQDGNEHILHIIGAGSTFNDIAAMDGSTNPANAAALNADTELWLIPADAFAETLLQEPKLALNLEDGRAHV